MKCIQGRHARITRRQSNRAPHYRRECTRHSRQAVQLNLARHAERSLVDRPHSLSAWNIRILRNSRQDQRAADHSLRPLSRPPSSTVRCCHPGSPRGGFNASTVSSDIPVLPYVSDRYSQRFPYEMPARVTVRLRGARSLDDEALTYPGSMPQFPGATQLRTLEQITHDPLPADERRAMADAVHHLETIRGQDLTRRLGEVSVVSLTLDSQAFLFRLVRAKANRGPTASRKSAGRTTCRSAITHTSPPG
jgi:hypothetical protein